MYWLQHRPHTELIGMQKRTWLARPLPTQG